MPVALLALAIGAFGIGTTEFVMMGVLPEAASEFAVSDATAGQFISSYALGVVVGAPLLTALTVRLSRKTVLLLMMALFSVGNILFAISPNKDMGILFRFLAGLPHGAFFGAGAVVAASLVGRTQRAKAVSMMFMGLTIANIVGVPLGTLLGQQAGWRATFLVVAAVGVLAFAAIIRWVPNHGKPQTPSLRGELSVFRLPQIWLALLIVIFGFGGVFACLSYISPILTGVSGYSPGEVILLLSLAGAGMTTGNFLGGRLADRLPSLSLYGALVALTAVLTTFTLTAHSKPGAAITLFFVGLTGFTLAPIMQARIMAKADGSPSLVSAAVQSAFNIANSMGAYVGGVVIAGGLGLLAPNLAGAVMAVTGLIIAVFSGVLDQRARARARIHDEESPAHEQREELVAC